MSTWFSQLEIFSFNNGGSGTKFLPSLFSFGKIMNAKGFFPLSSFEVRVLAAIVEINNFCKEQVKGFSVQVS